MNSSRARTTDKTHRISSEATGLDKSVRETKRSPWILAMCLCLLASSASAGDDAHAVASRLSGAEADQHACLRCHAMPTLAYRNPDDGQILDLSIDRDALAHSVHGEMACIDCHRRSYRRYPHPERAAPGDLDCIGCHQDDDDGLSRGWVDIDREFHLSIHATSDAPEAAGFSCHSCHDPHRFRTAEVGEPIGQIVRNHNEVCLSCHQELIAPQNASHHWLPNRDAHWTSVRCVDCHTPVALYANHQILPAEQSEQNCVSCHSADSQLLARLYHFRSEEDIARSGLLAKALYNEAYVVGMSKSPLLDRLSLLLLGLVFLMLTAHGVGRYLAHRAKRKS